jgi:hypothetical protein
MTRTAHGCLLILFSIVLAGCSTETPAKSTETPALAQPTAAPAPAPAPTPAPASTAASDPAPAPAPPSGPVLGSQDTNLPGIVAEFTECKRKEGVLSVKVRLRNVSPKEIGIAVFNQRNWQSYYYTAANKKYFILKDSDGTYLTPATDGIGSLEVRLQKDQQYVWWAKFPAPPADVKKITFMTPLTPPFEDIPITDQ